MRIIILFVLSVFTGCTTIEQGVDSVGSVVQTVVKEATKAAKNVGDSLPTSKKEKSTKSSLFSQSPFEGFLGHLADSNIGAAVGCDNLNARQLLFYKELVEPAIKSGILETSQISEDVAFSSKVNVLSGGLIMNRSGIDFDKSNITRILVFGCWLTDEIVEEELGGVKRLYAKATYTINPIIENTALQEIRMCSEHESLPNVIKRSDYRFDLADLSEPDVTPCFGKYNPKGKIKPSRPYLISPTSLAGQTRFISVTRWPNQENKLAVSSFGNVPVKEQ